MTDLLEVVQRTGKDGPVAMWQAWAWGRELPNYIMFPSGNVGFSPAYTRVFPAPQLFLSAITMDPDSDYPPSDSSSSSSEDNKKNAPTMDSRPTAKELLGTC